MKKIPVLHSLHNSHLLFFYQIKLPERQGNTVQYLPYLCKLFVRNFSAPYLAKKNKTFLPQNFSISDLSFRLHFTKFKLNFSLKFDDYIQYKFVPKNFQTYMHLQYVELDARNNK